MPHLEPPTGEAAEPSFPQHYPPTIWSFTYFLYISFMYFIYVCLLWNPIILILYIGITCIAYFPIILTWIKVIQIYHFFLSLLALFFFLFPLLISFILFETCGFSNQYSKLISLRRYHFLPIISITHATLRTMLSSVGGRVEEGSFFFCYLC